jgi:uncharacterized membrane protein YkoI
MKFALPLVFLFAITTSMGVAGQGSFVSAISTIKNNQHAKEQLRVKSSKQAAQMARGRFGGKVLKVQKQKSGYRVKLIKTDGHIISAYVDAKTGRISGG